MKSILSEDNVLNFCLKKGKFPSVEAITTARYSAFVEYYKDKIAKQTEKFLEKIDDAHKEANPTLIESELIENLGTAVLKEAPFEKLQSYVELLKTKEEE